MHAAPWQITDSFSEEFIKTDFNPTDWKPIEKFPVAVQNIYPKNAKHGLHAENKV